MTTKSAYKASAPIALPTIINFPRPGSLRATTDISLAPMLNFHESYTGSLNTSALDALQQSHFQDSQSRQHKLYLVPTPQHVDGEEPDTEFAPKPSPLADLPPLHETISRYVLGVVEIWGGRRQPMQLARLSHRLVYTKIAAMAGNQKEIPKIRKVYVQEPIEGVAETTVTLRFNDRVRSLVLRFEGVDNRWLCTEFALL